MQTFSVYSEEFRPYGKVIPGYDTAALCKAMEQIAMPREGVNYEAAVDALEKLDIFRELSDRAYNACNMDGGSSSVMLYRDSNGLYGNAGDVIFVNNQSPLQAEPRRMPNFWMVRPAS